MKIIILSLFILTNCLFIEATFAQHKSKNNIASQPIWGPVGYDYIKYYYLPDIQVYYYVKKEKFIYFENGHWISKTSIPARCFGYNLYKGNVIVMNETKPYLHQHNYSSKYTLVKVALKQLIIRDSHELKYMENKNHPDHLIWLEITGNERRRSMDLL